jgi:hypothetical protein
MTRWALRDHTIGAMTLLVEARSALPGTLLS